MSLKPGTTKKVLRPICLDAGPPGLWRISGKGSVPEDYKAIFDKVITRDNNFCVYCGFRCATQESVKLNGIEIHSLDGYDDHLDVDNFVTSCNFCRMDFNLEYAGSEQKAILAYIPELSQALVNNIVRAIMFVRYEVECEKQAIADAAAKAQAEMAQAQSLGGGGAAAASLLNEAVGASNRQNNDSTLRALMPILDAAEALYATMKNRSVYVEELIGTSRPEVLGRGIISIRNTQDLNIDSKLLDSARSVTTEFREKFHEYSDRLDSQFGTPDEPKANAAIDIDDILQGIRVIPTQPGCDPKTWGKPAGAFMTSMPLQWLNSYQTLLNKISEQGLTIEMPVPSETIGTNETIPDTTKAE